MSFNCPKIPHEVPVEKTVPCDKLSASATERIPAAISRAPQLSPAAPCLPKRDLQGFKTYTKDITAYLSIIIYLSNLISSNHI